jgi:Fe-S-cluster containining protein
MADDGAHRNPEAGSEQGDQVGLHLTTAFSYACQRCRRCCTGKRIQVNPYEVARLARNRGIAAAELRARFTLNSEGTVLAQTDSGACVFLGPEGCTVHPDRPLVCRLYPLGRHIEESGRVSYSHVELEPPPGGRFGTDGTIDDYFQSQGAGPFIAAADAYFAWYCRVVRSLGSPQAEPDGERETAWPEDLLDLDAAVERDCARQGSDPPQSLDERLLYHLSLLDAQLAGADG